MRINKNIKKHIWRLMSEALLNHYEVEILRRNNFTIPMEMNLDVEVAPLPIRREIHCTKLDKRAQRRLYTSIKADMLKKDLGYRYIAMTTIPIIHDDVVVQFSARNADTKKFWKHMDHYLANP